MAKGNLLTTTRIMEEKNMKYEKPVVIIYDEEVMKEIEALASSNTCHCTSSGSKACKKSK